MTHPESAVLDKIAELEAEEAAAPWYVKYELAKRCGARMRVLNSPATVAHETDFHAIHRDGLWWYEAPMPRRWHRCTVWTAAAMDDHLVDRCACGAISWERGPWTLRNDRRKHPGIEAAFAQLAHAIDSWGESLASLADAAEARVSALQEAAEWDTRSNPFRLSVYQMPVDGGATGRMLLSAEHPTDTEGGTPA